LESDEESQASGVPLSGNDITIIEFGKKAVLESVLVINDHIKTMIPLATGVISVYFALLEFLSVDKAIESAKLGPSTLIEPPLALFFGLIAFIIVSFPLLKKIDIDNITSVTSYRRFMIIWRYSGAGIGMAFFLYGVLKMIYVMTQVVGSS
jgi:hypothetical protein